jgi:hypothetical protein
MEVLHNISACSFFCSCMNENENNLTMIQARVSILRFPSQKVNCLIYSNSIYQHLKRLNAFLSTLHYKCARLECLHLNGGATNIQKRFKNIRCWRCPAVYSLLHALARLASCRCSCIILLGSKDFMGSCP